MSRPAPEAPTATAPDPAAGEGENPRDHSGRLLVRMPKSLHAELARSAERDGTSLNAFIVGALSGAVGWRTPEDGTPARRAAAPPRPRARARALPGPQGQPRGPRARHRGRRRAAAHRLAGLNEIDRSG